jgi:hypothetical protein
MLRLLRSKIAVTVLESLGALAPATPGSTDANEVRRVQNLERKKAATALKRAESKAELDKLTAM